VGRALTLTLYPVLNRLRNLVLHRTLNLYRERNGTSPRRSTTPATPADKQLRNLKSVQTPRLKLFSNYIPVSHFSVSHFSVSRFSVSRIPVSQRFLVMM
jgi:hypothetical protein